MFKIAGEATTGVVSADIYFPDLPPFDGSRRTSISSPPSRRRTRIPDKGEALGAQALMVWARAANATKSLDRKTVAGAIRGEKIGGTLLGEMTFEANGQAQHKPTLFKVTDGKTTKIEVLK